MSRGSGGESGHLHGPASDLADAARGTAAEGKNLGRDCVPGGPNPSSAARAA
jgi:hypothetical protein